MRIALIDHRVLEALLACAVLAGCGLGGDVREDGEYQFLPGSSAVDTTPYPLADMLIVEDDAATERVYVYLFSGELARAQVGLQDIRRITFRQRGFQMAFETPRARYVDDEVVSRGLPLQARFGDQAFELARLDDAGLRQTGADRFVGSTRSGDYEVRAYFGVLPHEAPLGELVIERDEGDLVLEPALPAMLLLPRVDEDGLGLELSGSDAGPPPADHLVIDVLQAIAPKVSPDEDAGAPALETEAIVRTLLAANGEYLAAPSLLTDAAGKGCWSADDPLDVRVAQVRRRYVPREGGDLAITHQRLDVAKVPATAWSELLGDVSAAPYCADYD